ncbi:hypothetical protein OC844_000030 [Tilletia horrida]|nr:hypothetical protein OC844_000030 [Tilletia horrida]
MAARGPNINCTAVHTGPLYIYNQFYKNTTASSISVSHPSGAGYPQLVTPSPSGPHDYTFYACSSNYMGWPTKQTIGAKTGNLTNYYGIIGKGAPDRSGLSQDCLIRDAIPETASRADLVRYACNYMDAQIQRQQFWTLIYSPNGRHKYDLFPIVEPKGADAVDTGFSIDAEGNTRLQFDGKYDSYLVAFLGEAGSPTPNV